MNKNEVFELRKKALHLMEDNAVVKQHLKGKLTANHKSFSLRSGLVVFQFFISVALIIGTIVVYQQMQYIQNKDLGYNKEQLLTIPNSYVLGNNEHVFKQQMMQDPRIVNLVD